jgi:hypothetical protein
LHAATWDCQTGRLLQLLAAADALPVVVPKFCLQGKVIVLLAAAWEAPLAEVTQPWLNIADLLHLAVNLQDPSSAVAMLQFVQQLRQQLASMQQLQEQLQELRKQRE